jgi:PAS domain S-box-containing protein
LEIRDIIGKLSSQFILFYFNDSRDEIEIKKISYFTRTIILVTIALLLLLSIIRILVPPGTNLSDYMIWTLIALLAIIYLVFKKGKVYLAGFLYVITMWFAMTSLAWVFEGVRDVAIVAYILIVLIAILITKPWQALTLGAISLISLWGIYLAEKNHIITPAKEPSLNYTIEFSVILVFVIVLVNLTAKNTSDFYKRIKKELDDRILAEKALNESEERFKTLSSFGSEGLMIHDDGFTLEVNKTFASLLGYSNPEELIGKKGFDIIHFTPESRKIVNDNLKKKSNDTFDIEIVNAKGEVIPMETKSREIFFKGREMRLVSMRDITKRKMFEEALIRSKALLASIIDSTSDLIWSVDTDQYRLLTFNKGLESVLGESDIHIKEGVLHEDIFPPDSVRRLYELYSQTLKEGSLITMFETNIGKRTLWLNLHLLSRESKPYAISGFAKDITELKKAQEALILAKEKAEESDRLKTAFMNNISHEVRTPLNGIMGFSQLVIQPDITQKEKGFYLDLLNLSCERLLSTITNYMDISLIESGNIEINRESIKISGILDKIVDLFSPKCVAKKLELIKEIQSKDENNTFYLDAVLLEKSISHLVDNAIKFTHKGSIKLGFRFLNNQYEIYVRDTGPGINHTSQGKIYDYFMQGEVSNTRPYEGSGLGLSIAKKLVELMGGKIRLESEEGKGSAFFIVFPKEKQKTSPDLEVASKKKTHIPSRTSPLILIVDDDEISRLFHEKILAKASFKFIIAKSGFEALEICRNNPDISLTLMDIKMADMDGLMTTRKIKEFRKDMPIIAISAYAMIGDKEKAINAGCDDYIMKPVSDSLLLSSIIKQLRQL